MQRETKFLFRVALMFLLFFLQQVMINACDLCGCFIGVLPYDNQSSFGLMHRYRIFSGYPDYASGTIFPQGAYRSSPPSPLHASGTNAVRSPGDYESYKVIELRGKWFIHPRVELNFILPFSDNRESTNGIKQRVNGFGDATFFAGYHLIRKTEEGNYRHRLVVGLGIKLPTGNFSAKNPDGDRISILMQTGTGSTDGMAYIAYTGGGHNFRWGATLSGKINGSNSFNEKMSPGTSNTFFLAYVLQAGAWKFLPQMQVYHEYSEGLRVKEVLVTGTKMSCIMTGPSLDIFVKNFGLTLGMQFPVYEVKESYNLMSKGKMFAGITWSFNQKNYLFGSPKKS